MEVEAELRITEAAEGLPSQCVAELAVGIAGDGDVPFRPDRRLVNGALQLDLEMLAIGFQGPLSAAERDGVPALVSHGDVQPGEDPLTAHAQVPHVGPVEHAAQPARLEPGRERAHHCTWAARRSLPRAVQRSMATATMMMDPTKISCT